MIGMASRQVSPWLDQELTAQPNHAGRILLVETSQGPNLALRELLEARGFRVVRTTHAAFDIEVARREVVDVVVLDLSRGEAAVACCRRNQSASGVIVLVRGSDIESGLNALEAGADDFLAVPHNPRELLARIRALMRGRRRRSALRSLSLGQNLLLASAGRVVADDGRSIFLTPLQHRLLEAPIDDQGP